MNKKFSILIVSLLFTSIGCQNTAPISHPFEYSSTADHSIKKGNEPMLVNSLQNEKTSQTISKVSLMNNLRNELDTKEYNWFTKYQGKGLPPSGPDDNNYYKSDPNTFYLGNTSKKSIYLTFDQGYENGYTTKILDTLKAQNVKAAFFCVKPYLTTNQELVKRMVDEGHIVCNHSARHPSMAKITDYAKFKSEITDVEDIYKQIVGKDMPKFFRPPMGKYSQLALKYTNDCGYKTVFWSFAYMDWITDKQPTAEYAKNKIFSKVHNGAILLLHSVSKTNAEILNEVILELKKQGYEFKTLYDL